MRGRLKLAAASLAALCMTGATGAFAAAPADGAPPLGVGASPSTEEPAPPAGDEAVEPVKPTACQEFKADPKSKVIGKWSLRQRDDGMDWAGPWPIEFKPDGVWLQGEADSGFWCQHKNMIFFGFADEPYTTYRGELNLSGMLKGTESWDQSGTGIFEAKRAK